eukprot:2079396-Amphidinium_carterae.1
MTTVNALGASMQWLWLSALGASIQYCVSCALWLWFEAFQYRLGVESFNSTIEGVAAQCNLSPFENGWGERTA